MVRGSDVRSAAASSMPARRLAITMCFTSGREQECMRNRSAHGHEQMLQDGNWDVRGGEGC